MTKTVEWSRTRFPPCRPLLENVFYLKAILEARLGENFIGPKNQEQVYLELVFAADHDAVMVESI